MIQQGIDIQRFDNGNVRQLFHAVSEGVLTFNSSMIITHVNAYAQKITGYTLEELVGKNLSLLFDEKDLNLFADVDSAEFTLKKKETVQFNVVLHSKSKEYEDVYLSISRMGIGPLNTFFAFFNRINSKEHLSDKSDNTHDKDRVSLPEEYRHFGDNIFALDRKGIILDMNKGFFGIPLEIFIGKNVIDLLSYENEREKVRNAIEHSFSKKESTEYTISFWFNNSKLCYTTSLNPMFSDGKVSYVLAIARDVSTIKEKEETAEQLASIVQLSTDFIGIAGLDGSPYFLNEAGKKLTGIESNEELIKLSIQDFLDEGGKNLFREEVLPIALEKGSWSGKVNLVHTKTKELIRAEVDLIIKNDSNTGEPNSIYAIARDIRDREQYENELIKRDRDLKEAHKIGKFGSWELDLQSNKLVWTEEIYNFFDMDHSVASSYDLFLEHIHPDDVKMVKSAFDQHLKLGTKYDIVHRIVRPNGEIKYLNERCETIRDEQGAPIRSIGTAVDITEQKLIELELQEYKTELESLVRERTAELEKANTELIKTGSEIKETNEKLRINEIKYRFLAENMHDVVIAYDVNLNPAYVSPSIERLIGFSPQEVYEMNMQDMLHPDDLIYLDDVKEKIKARKRNEAIYKIRVITKNKGYIWVESAVSFFSRDEIIEGIIASNRDITHEIEAEEQLKNAQLKLVQADKLASLGMLTAGIAHEINNPVNFIIAGASLLENNLSELKKILNAYDGLFEGDVSDVMHKVNNIKNELNYEKLLEYTERSVLNIKNGALRSSEIIKGLQDFSRTNTSELVKVDIEKKLNEALVILHHQYKDRITLEKEFEGVPKVLGNPGKLVQVCLNILVNAIQSIEKKGSIHVQTKTVLRGERNYVLVSISDTGCGMTKEVQQRIFDPFFTTKKMGEGTGLGLSISHGIINEYNGILEVESEVGKGSTFKIYLPV